MAQYGKRFITVLKESTLTTETKILADRETGINYLWHAVGTAGGLTPLLRADGTPVVTPRSELTEL